MKKKFVSFSILLALLFSLIVAREFSQRRNVPVFDVNPITIKAGYDIFRTTGAGKDFSILPIRGDFFGPGSSDFSGVMVFEGDPLISFMGIPLPTPTATSPENQIDTVIRRLNDATLDNIGSKAKVEVQRYILW